MFSRGLRQHPCTSPASEQECQRQCPDGGRNGTCGRGKPLPHWGHGVFAKSQRHRGECSRRKLHRVNASAGCPSARHEHRSVPAEGRKFCGGERCAELHGAVGCPGHPPADEPVVRQSLPRPVRESSFRKPGLTTLLKI